MENKNIYIDKNKLDDILKQFEKETSYYVKHNGTDPNKSIIHLIHPDYHKGVVNIYWLKNGNATIHYKQGKNQEAGEELFNYLLKYG